MLIGARGSSTLGGIVVPDSTRLYTGTCTVAGGAGGGGVVPDGTVVGGACELGEHESARFVGMPWTISSLIEAQRQRG